MLQLTWWLPLLLLPLPLFMQRMSPDHRESADALTIPLLQRCGTGEPAPRPLHTRLSRAGLWLCWLCLVVASCRPYWLGEPTHRTLSGRDLLLAIDISGSMQEADMVVQGRLTSRIDVLKRVVSEFTRRRSGDRIGVIVFGSEAHLYVPLTFDTTVLGELINDISTGLAGRLTAIGDAIGIAINAIAEQRSTHSVLILITDGSNTAGASEPLQAARIARQEGMTIYTIGVGNDEKTMRELLQSNNVAAGTVLNETILQQVALLTGGRYFRARDSQSLEQIYQTLDQLEPANFNARLHRPRESLTRYPVLVAVLVLLTLLVWRAGTVYRR